MIVWICLPSRDNFGQDASIRAAAGWISGPMYGYDPIQQFADQIAEMKKGEACRKCRGELGHTFVGNPASHIGPEDCEACA